MVMKIDERIRELRALTGITQSYLAKKMGVTRSCVNTWEMGIAIPSTSKLIELALFFHVSTDYLLGLDETKRIEVERLNEEERGIIHSLIEYFEKQKDVE